MDAKKIKASTHDGVVEVTIPLPSKPEKTKVEIKPTAENQPGMRRRRTRRDGGVGPGDSTRRIWLRRRHV